MLCYIIAVERSVLPQEFIVEHDFTRGIWYPNKSYDAVWSVEFLEHVGRQYILNYMPVFQQAALIFVTSSFSGGWHHVEVHESWWWITLFTMHGFVYSEILTHRIRNTAAATSRQGHGLRILRRMMVFVNPAVASRPQHSHLLFGEHGCIYESEMKIPCSPRFNWYDENIDSIPGRFQPLLNCEFTSVHKEEVDNNSSEAVMQSWDNNAHGVWNCTRNDYYNKAK